MDEESREQINMKTWFYENKLPSLVQQAFDGGCDQIGGGIMGKMMITRFTNANIYKLTAYYGIVL